MQETQTQERVELHVLHTSCKECVFATYTDKTQTGCEMGRLDKYREQGAEIVGACDDEKEFEIVNGRSCPAHRDRRSAWAQSVRPENRAAAVRAELTIRTDVIVPLMSAAGMELLPESLESLKKLALKPSSVVVVNNQGDVKTGAIHAQMSKLGQGLNWKLVDVFERTTDGDRPDLNRCIDIVASKLKGHFYTVVIPGRVLPPTFTLDLDRAVVDEMSRFVALEAKDGLDGATVSLGFHKAPMVNGNKAVPALALDDEEEADTAPTLLLTSALEKAKYLAASKKSPHLVRRAEDVCPGLA